MEGAGKGAPALACKQRSSDHSAFEQACEVRALAGAGGTG